MGGKRAVRQVVYDTNYWKSFVHARLAVAMGDRGCLSLFGDNAETRRLFAEHLSAEYRVKAEAERSTNGRCVRNEPTITGSIVSLAARSPRPCRACR